MRRGRPMNRNPRSVSDAPGTVVQRTEVVKTRRGRGLFASHAGPVSVAEHCASLHNYDLIAKT